MNLRKLWLVAWSTYSQQVRARYFIVLTLALPLLLVGSAAIPILTGSGEQAAAMGWVDLSGRLAPVNETSADGELRLMAYGDVAQAEAGMRAGAVEGYLVIADSYLRDGALAYHGATNPSADTVTRLKSALRHALAPEAPEWLLARLEEPAVWRFEDLDTGRVLEQGLEVQIWALMPLALGMVFVLILSTTLNSVGPAVVREKEERSMEMILTSLRPNELVGGKLLGTALLTLTQLAVWVVVAFVCLCAMWADQGHAGVPDLPWRVIAWGALLCVPGYLLYSALAAGLGILAGNRGAGAADVRSPLDGRSSAGVHAYRRDGERGRPRCAVALSLVPLFSPTFALFRMMVIAVPDLATRDRREPALACCTGCVLGDGQAVPGLGTLVRPGAEPPPHLAGPDGPHRGQDGLR